jgi:E3 ubiquitin-protein ligase SIAH1
MENLTKDVNEGLLKALECSRCKKYLVPPISFCEGGHNICSGCRPELSRCPECQQPYLRSTNQTLENVVRQVSFPCIYKKVGCQESFPIHLMQEHEEDCPYRPYNCPVILPEHRRCQWKGPRLAMKQHIQSCHKANIWEGTGVYSKKQLMVSSTGIHNDVVITFGEVFYVHFRGQNNNYYGFVKYIGPKRNAKRYRSTISIVSMDGNEFLTSCYITNNFQEANEDIIATGKCLKLHYDVIRKFLDNGSNMYVKIEISKIVPPENDTTTTGQKS